MFLFVNFVQIFIILFIALKWNFKIFSLLRKWISNVQCLVNMDVVLTSYDLNLFKNFKLEDMERRLSSWNTLSLESAFQIHKRDDDYNRSSRRRRPNTVRFLIINNNLISSFVLFSVILLINYFTYYIIIQLSILLT